MLEQKQKSILFANYFLWGCKTGGFCYNDSMYTYKQTEGAGRSPHIGAWKRKGIVLLALVLLLSGVLPGCSGSRGDGTVVCLQFVHEPHTAEDLTQDTFLSAFSAIDRCEPQYYKAWLVRVAANKCKDHLKSSWVRRVEAPGDDALPEPRGAPLGDAQDPIEQLTERAGAAEVETMVRSLREPYGRIAVLYFLEHKTTAEIAAAVGRPPATVNNQLWRAKNILRQQIIERRQKE